MKRAIIATLTFAAATLLTVAHGQSTQDVAYYPNVPLMLPASDSFRQSFVRIVNLSEEAGEVRIIAIDDGGNVYDTVTIQLTARQGYHFNSGDLADGNPNKGIGQGIGSPRQGNWRLSIETDLAIEVLNYVRTRDGFLAPTIDILPVYYPAVADDRQVLLASTFNPASNLERQSRLRLINWGAEDETLKIEGTDDAGIIRGSVSLTLPAGRSRTLTAVDLEQGAHGLEGTLGDGVGKWAIHVSGNVSSIVGQNLLYASSGHISNLSAGGGGIGVRNGVIKGVVGRAHYGLAWYDGGDGDYGVIFRGPYETLSAASREVIEACNRATAGRRSAHSCHFWAIPATGHCFAFAIAANLVPPRGAKPYGISVLRRVIGRADHGQRGAESRAMFHCREGQGGERCEIRMSDCP